MALGTFAGSHFAAKNFAPVTLHGTVVVTPPVTTPVGGGTLRPRFAPPSREFLEVRLAFFAEGHARARMALAKETEVYLALSGGGVATGAISEAAGRATRLDRLMREDDELLDLL